MYKRTFILLIPIINDDYCNFWVTFLARSKLVLIEIGLGQEVQRA